MCRHANADLNNNDDNEMIIKRLRATNFRNYSQLDVSLNSGVNILLGENGQGKTNFLEAIFITSKGSSFRPGTSTNWIHTGNNIGASVVAYMKKQNNFKHELKLALEGNRKVFFVDNKKATRSKILKEFPCVLFSPESLSVVKSGPEARRELIDDFLISHTPSSLDFIEAFGRILRSRNRLLRDTKRGLLTNKLEINQVLDSLDPKFIETATQFTEARLTAIRAIQPDLNEMLKRLFPLPGNVDISVDYLISGESAQNWNTEQIKQAIECRLKSLRYAELESGVSLVGPQKHDIRFLFSGQDARYFCSQGQQRAIILSFKMAQIMYHYRVHHEYPILLLDDVLSELDQERRTNLIEALKSIESQIIVTTTDLSFSRDFGGSELMVYRVKKGTILESRF